MAESKRGGSRAGVALDLPPPALLTQSDGTFEVNHAVLVLHTKITYHTVGFYYLTPLTEYNGNHERRHNIGRLKRAIKCVSFVLRGYRATQLGM